MEDEVDCFFSILLDLDFQRQQASMGSKDSPFSLEAYDRYTEKQPDVDRKVYLWHMHAYSPDNDGNVLRQFQDMISARFGADANVRYGNLALKAAGPHPCAQLEFDFTRTVFADVISWAMFNRPDNLSVLIHPFDDHQAEAHSARAMWLGPPLDLKLEPVQGFDSMVARKVAEGATVNEVLCAFVSPGGRLANRRAAVAGA
ncbi:hypothetical protein CVIRNUC_005496 [Coccomyxa viridis]|uniref:DOPA 4,5-dioxygenase n=1 Tax=Coccomyxa viridis TaxID=1274662 RepID=A0AAV1I590_9CHLO|nr:hypothetical protein CVIRNUC_005496 [Coccomyxa viridis]